MGKSETEKLVGVIIEQWLKLSEATEPFYRAVGFREKANELRERREQVKRRLLKKDAPRQEKI